MNVSLFNSLVCNTIDEKIKWILYSHNTYFREGTFINTYFREGTFYSM